VSKASPVHHHVDAHVDAHESTESTDRSDYAMQRKLARQKSHAIDTKDVTEMAPNHWGFAPLTRVLDSDVDINNIVAENLLAEERDVLKEGTLKKRVVTRTIVWANRYVTLTPDEVLVSNKVGGDNRDSILLLDITECNLHTHDDRVL